MSHPINQTAVATATDRNHLSTKSYGNSKHLQARANIYKYKRSEVSAIEWGLSQVSWRGSETVLDMGCGPGVYLRLLSQYPAMRLIGMDLSHGMLNEVKSNWTSSPALPMLSVSDAQSIPIADQTCDVVLAMHMLYHMPDIFAAVREFRRVLQPDGTLLASTNSSAHLSEFRDLFHAAHEEVAGQTIPKEAHWSQRFSLETGHELLASIFAHVEKHELPGELVIPEYAPVVNYLESTRSTMEKTLLSNVAWESVMEVVAQKVDATIKTQGAFKARTAPGVFKCTI